MLTTLAPFFPLLLVARSHHWHSTEKETRTSRCWLYSVQNELYQVRRLSKSDLMNTLTHCRPRGLFRNQIRASVHSTDCRSVKFIW